MSNSQDDPLRQVQRELQAELDKFRAEVVEQNNRTERTLGRLEGRLERVDKHLAALQRAQRPVSPDKPEGAILDIPPSRAPARSDPDAAAPRPSETGLRF
jgi:uncharacterized membrane-anchored protein YhcB (DUF1043 family)